MTDTMHFETAAIHAGQDPDPATGAAIVPIYQTSTYVQDSVGEHKGYEYSRTDNPTRSALETCTAALERATHGIAFSSGMAATTAIALTLEAGDRVLIPDDVYGGTYRLFAKVTRQFGLDFAAIDMTDISTVEREAAKGVTLLFAETPTNPKLHVLDLEALGKVAKGASALFVVDNTFATPYIQRPLDFGAHASLYSATKYLGGHSDLVAGAIATSNDELAAKLRFVQNAVGGVPGPFDAWLWLRGLKTLGIRMRQHSRNAAQIAEWLTQREGVTRVLYPGLPDFAGYEIATKQMAAAGEPLYGGMVSVELETEERALEVCERTQLFFLGESLGGVESLIEHPARMTHASLAGSGMEVSPGLLRLSVGIEHVDDLIADLDRALS
jgi:cystathionine gamma-synthase